MFEIFEKEEENDPDENTNYKLRLIKITKHKIEAEIKDLAKEAYLESKFLLTTAIGDDSKSFYALVMAD